MLQSQMNTSFTGRKGRKSEEDVFRFIGDGGSATYHERI